MRNGRTKSKTAGDQNRGLATLGGTAAGAAAGALIGPVGAAAGAVLGGVAGALSGDRAVRKKVKRLTSRLRSGKMVSGRKTKTKSQPGKAGSRKSTSQKGGRR